VEDMGFDAVRVMCKADCNEGAVPRPDGRGGFTRKRKEEGVGGVMAKMVMHDIMTKATCSWGMLGEDRQVMWVTRKSAEVGAGLGTLCCWMNGRLQT
jgi:hypothetical protein